VIPHGMVVLIRRLLAEGKLSQRAISRVTRVGRSTVATIAAGTRRDRSLCRPEEFDLFPQHSGVSERCPGCGGRVYMPCRLCYVRELKRLDALGRQNCRHALPVSLRESDHEKTAASGVSPSSARVICPAPAAYEGSGLFVSSSD